MIILQLLQIFRFPILPSDLQYSLRNSQKCFLLQTVHCRVQYVFIMVKMFVEPTQERDRCCKLLTKLESSLATLYKIIFTKFSNKYLKRRSSMSPDFLKLHIHFQKKNILKKLFLNLRDNLLSV